MVYNTNALTLCDNIHDIIIVDIAAYPSSVNLLDGVTDDIRTPDKLINGINDTHDPSNMWLAPILPYTVSDKGGGSLWAKGQTVPQTKIEFCVLSQNNINCFSEKLY